MLRPARAMSDAFYVVWIGRCPGVYSTWDACRAQVDGFAGARFRKLASPEEAARAWEHGPGYRDEAGARPEAFPPGSIAVDAACAGNPGAMEYRGVDLVSGDELFHVGPMHGTNNLGEFLAVVHGLSVQLGRGSSAPVWSDSRTAMAWVRDRRVGCTLARHGEAARAWALADRALAWLAAHPDHGVVHKWPTAEWGEIPADFGRK